MKIGIICENYPPAVVEGGIAHYSEHLAHNLTAIGEDVVIITGEGHCGDGSDEGIPVLRFPGKWDGRTARQMARRLRVLGVDIVNLQYSPVMYPARFKLVWGSVTRGFASVVSFHTLWGGSKLNHLAALGFLSSGNGIIATNSEIIYLLRRYLPFFLKKTCFIPIGANIEPGDTEGDYREIAARYSLDPNLPVLVYFGMAYPGKGMDLLFEATRILLQKYGVDVRLLVIGGGISDAPKYVEEKKRLTAKLSIEGRVIWTGRLPAREVSGLLTGSDVAVLPFEAGVSDRRGSLMAALAHHKAVVTTKPAVPIALFKNGENMVWPDKNDAGSLAELVLRVLQNHELRRILENGATELAKHFEWSQIAKQTRTCFLDVLQCH